MSTTNLLMTGETVRIVDGPEPVTLNFKTGVGEFFIQDALAPGQTPPAPPVGRVGSYLGLDPKSMGLEADQSVYVRGHGLLVIQSRTRAS